MRASVEVSAIHNRSIEPVTITRQDGRYLRLEPGEQIEGPFTYRYDDEDAEHVPSPNETWFVDSPLAFKWGSVTFTTETELGPEAQAG